MTGHAAATDHLDDLRYPIGRHARAAGYSAVERAQFVDRLAALPNALRASVAGLDDAQLDTPYRPDGWTVRQLVHHVADSHLNAYLRIKLALTEHEPTIKPYDQDAWVTLADAMAPPEVSLTLVDALHSRLTLLLRALPADAFARRLLHPENGPMSIDNVIALYAWHGDHHTAQLRGIRDRSGW